MMLLMNQADTIHEIRKHELEILDQEREDEEVYVYVYPVTESSITLTLKVQNRGNLVVNVVQLWINDEPQGLEDFVLSPMSSDEIILDEANYGFIPELGNSYLIKINSARGNVFSSNSGSLYYNDEYKWEGGAYALNFQISYPESGWYEIEIWDEEDTLITVPPFKVQKSANAPAFAFFQVDSHGKYHVHITKNSSNIHDADTTIYEYGSPVEWVFA